MKAKRLIDIAIRLKRYLGKSSDALRMTLELALVKKYLPELMQELKESHADQGKIEVLLNKAYQKLQIEEKITLYGEDISLPILVKHLIQSPVDPDAIAAFIQEFTIEKSGNDLYQYSTPIELKKLMTGLLDIRQGESVYNPCFGIGGLFGTLADISNDIALYGEEIEGSNRKIGGLTAQLSGITNCSLEQGDVLINEEKECRQFDKVICNPPFDADLDSETLSKDIQFTRYGIAPSNASELAFMEHVICSLKERAVILVRETVLQRHSNEAVIRTKMALDGKIEAIISLPHGIIPYWQEEMALVILSHGNNSIQFIDANQPYFSKRKGRRNTIYRYEEIIDIVLKDVESEYSVHIKIENIELKSLSPKYYLETKKKGQLLSDISEVIFRAQRLGGGINEKEFITYKELKLQDIKPNQYTVSVHEKRRGSQQRVDTFRLKAFDILLPLRGGPSVIGILGINDEVIVANAGVITIRLTEESKAKALYLYLLSEKGQVALNNLYSVSPNKTINPDILGMLSIDIVLDKSEKKFLRLMILQKNVEDIEKEISVVLLDAHL